MCAIYRLEAGSPTSVCYLTVSRPNANRRARAFGGSLSARLARHNLSRARCLLLSPLLSSPLLLLRISLGLQAALSHTLALTLVYPQVKLYYIQGIKGLLTVYNREVTRPKGSVVAQLSAADAAPRCPPSRGEAYAPSPPVTPACRGARCSACAEARSARWRSRRAPRT